MSSYRILIVEDDTTISRLVKNSLEQWDYEVTLVEDFKNVLSQVEEYKPELILLDINLPFQNGFSLCRQFRRITQAPVVFLSSEDDNMNIVMAMDMGGDDFISKPFDMNVLVAKINALIRRTYAYQGQSSILRVGEVILNLSDNTIKSETGTCELTKNEFKILQMLMEQAGSTVSRDDIMTALWEGNEFIDDNTLTVNVTRIRKKLSIIGQEDFIVTKKGLGYIIPR